MMGIGGAQMLWTLAWHRALPEHVAARPKRLQPFTPYIDPLPRDKVKPGNPASWEYYRLLDQVTHALEFIETGRVLGVWTMPIMRLHRPRF